MPRFQVRKALGHCSELCGNPCMCQEWGCWSRYGKTTSTSVPLERQTPLAFPPPILTEWQERLELRKSSVCQRVFPVMELKALSESLQSLPEPQFFFFLFINLFHLFIYFWLCWVFIAARRLSLVVENGGYSSLRCAGFSLRWLLLLWSTGSRCAGFSSCGTWASVVMAHGLSSCGSWALECRLSSCGARA